MKKDELNYKNLKVKIAEYEKKGRGESASFLNWFLVNVYRLDDVSADDAICDQSNDKGIDGIYVDDNAEEVHFFQSKLVQSEKKTIGDVGLKELLGSLKQFGTKESVDKIIEGGAHPDLKKILVRQNVASLIDKGYKPIGVFVCNQDSDGNTKELLAHTNSLIVFDKTSVVSEFVDFDAEEGVKDKFVFDASYVSPLRFDVDKGTFIYLLPVSATDLVKLGGIEDTTLFSQNVRLSLGNTPVNKSIKDSIHDPKEHKFFPLYHNGVTLLCEHAELKDGRLHVKNYVVVNGAQSISTFFKESKHLTNDLRVFAKIISLKEPNLTRKITINSNNQNAIKPRDLRSNHDLMLRLKAEFTAKPFPYEFEIKRGEKFDGSKLIISNEEAGRLLLAFDLREPYSCHQIYKVFDDKYSEIFGRPEVDASRIVFLFKIGDMIVGNLGELNSKQIAGYKLTKYLLVDIVSEILRKYEPTKKILSDKKILGNEKNSGAILKLLPELLGNLVVDLNYEIGEEGEGFDYKKEFKSPEKVKLWRDRLVRSYEKDVKRGKSVDFSIIKLA